MKTIFKKIGNFLIAHKIKVLITGLAITAVLSGTIVTISIVGGDCTHRDLYTKRENEIAATCTSDGSYDEVVYCEDCNEEISRTLKTLSSFGHKPSSPVRENVISATCTSDGKYDEVVYCVECDKELNRTQKTEARTGHSFIGKEFEVNACNVEGNYTIKYCKNCNVFAPTDTTILHAHSYVRKTDNVTFKSWFECEVCGDIIPKGDNSDVFYPENLSHNWQRYILNEATCTTSGLYVMECKDCKIKQSLPIPPLGHDWDVGIEITAPTCTQPGETYHTCIRCGEHKT